MKTIRENEDRFEGTFDGCSVDIERELEEGYDSNWYIRVRTENGCGGHLYDGWAPRHVITLEEAKREALIGACLLGPHRTRVIFLDVDGVLNTQSGWDRGHHGHDSLDPVPVGILNSLCARTKCRIVVSSTWRGIPRCREKLRESGVKASYHRQWRTRERRQDEWTHESRGRGRQIRDWLAAHPEVKRYAIVDDDSDMLPEQMPFFVQTGPWLGLEQSHADRIEAILTA